MRKESLDPQTLVRLGKGQYARFKHVDCARAWQGVTHAPPVPFDAVQAAINKSDGRYDG